MPSSQVDCSHRDARYYYFPFGTNVAIAEIPLEFGNLECFGTKFVLERIPSHSHGVSLFIRAVEEILGGNLRLLKIAVPGDRIRA